MSSNPIGDRGALASALSDRYEIDREIGRGGMAIVYLARDTKHDRRVAIKVLDPDLGAMLGADRFLSEIRVTASLQHPNVLPLFDSGEVSGLLYYVMPFIDGESLRTRLDRENQLPVDEALRIAVAIASAADYAHAHGIVHRDLKPDNILLQSGQPIVADFGIALAVSNAAGPRMTQTGISLGTPQYMSPEQATGDRTIDARSDVYAIAAITYEMLTGEPPHTGATSQAVIARLLTDQPRPVRELRSSVPEHVGDAIQHALEKLPADRFGTAKEFAEALQGRGTISGARSTLRTRRSTYTTTAATAVAGLAATLAGIGWWRAMHVPTPLPIRFTVEPPAGLSFSNGGGLKIALSPDGQSVAFATPDPNPQLFVRRVDQLEFDSFPNAFPLGPELHFSADGKSVAYWNSGPSVIAVGPGNAGASPRKLISLNTLGTIVSFSSNLIYLHANVFWSVPAAGGAPHKIVAIDTTVDLQWARPILLPDEKTIAFSVTLRNEVSAGAARLALASIEGGPRTLLDVNCIGVVGYANGVLVFNQPGGKLVGMKFDVARRKLSGQPIELLPNTRVLPTAVTMSADGTLAYMTLAPRSSRVEIIDETGALTSIVPGVKQYDQVIASPDGKRIALGVATPDGAAIWIYDSDSRGMLRLTQTWARLQAWSADAKRILFLGPGRGPNAFWIAADGSSGAELIPGTSALGRSVAALSLSPDGKYAVVIRTPLAGDSSTDAQSAFAVPLDGSPPLRLLPGTNVPLVARVSPNGNWIAYESRHTTSHEVYVRRFPTGDGQVQVSNDVGDDPQWSPDGQRLIYRSDKEYRAATLDFSGAMPRVVRTTVLFPKRDVVADPISSLSVLPDGKHFVVTHPLGAPIRLVVVANWMKEVREKFGEK